VLSPEPRAGAEPAAADPVLGTNLGNFRAHAMAMVEEHRRDPTKVQVSPYPVHYQVLGGEANALAPKDLLVQSEDTLLNGAGVPSELYRGTLSNQAAPSALRCFEARWAHLVEQMNGFLEWIVDRVTKLLEWEPVDCRLTKVRHADDMNRQMAILQLMMAGQISQQAGLRALNFTFETEQDNLLEEAEYVAKKQEEAAKKQQGRQAQQQLGQQPPPGAAPAQGGGAPPTAGLPPPASDPEALWEQAGSLAEQLQGMPETQRKSELMAIKQDDKILHAIVKARMEENRRDVQSAGGAQAMAGQFPQGQKVAAILRFPRGYSFGALASRVDANRKTA
jgi:hypothetical protein